MACARSPHVDCMCMNRNPLTPPPPLLTHTHTHTHTHTDTHTFLTHTCVHPQTHPSLHPTYSQAPLGRCFCDDLSGHWSIHGGHKVGATLYLGWARTIYLYLYSVHTIFQAGKSPYGHIRCVYTVLANPSYIP